MMVSLEDRGDSELDGFVGAGCVICIHGIDFIDCGIYN